MKNLLCPHCIRLLSQCSCKDGKLPLQFEVECRKAPPCWIVTAGFSQHGKTVFLSALTLLLGELGRVLPKFTFNYMDDQHTADRIREMRIEAAQGVVNDVTQKGKPVPLLMQIHTGFDVPSGYNSRTLAVYDAAGEYFQSLEKLRTNVPAVTQVEVVWFLVSLSDLENSSDQLTLADLFQSYHAALRQAGQSIRDRNIIVVLTKADEIEHRLPPEILRYLAEDDFKDLLTEREPSLPPFSLDEYLRTSGQISELLENFLETQNVRGSHNFINRARDEGANVRFCITSAQGHGDDQGKHVEKTTRYRVLDPLFWTLWLSHPGGNGGQIRNPLRLVLDASDDCDSIFTQRLPEKVWAAMSSRGEIITHFLGESRPASHAGQLPPSEPPTKRRARLIGPILESLPDDTRVLVLSNGDIIDQGDFIQSNWRDRVLIVVNREELQDTWPHTYMLRPNDDSETLVNHLFRMESDS